MSSTLPTDLHPNKDLMCKAITRDPSVINIITKALTGHKDDYFVGENEWKNRNRSDLVLEPKCLSSNLRPIIVEFQYHVDRSFMKRAAVYGVEAFKKYSIDPILIIFTTNSLSLEIKQSMTQSRLKGCYSYPCDVWAAECLIVSASSIEKCHLSEPLDPFMALCLFLLKGTTSLVDMPYSNDPTIKSLFNLAVNHMKSISGNNLHLIDALRQIVNERDRECDDMLQLLNNRVSYEELKQKINGIKSRNEVLKRKYAEINPTASSSSSTSSSSAEVTPEVLSDDTTRFIQGMKFVGRFKDARTALGKRRMDWVTCLNQGRKEKLFDYKSAKTLQTQFEKYQKRNK